MSDPRKNPGYKQQHADTRHEQLLGAILDALLALNEPLPVKEEPKPVVTTKSRKVREH